MENISTVERPPVKQCVATLWLQDAGLTPDQFEVDKDGEAIINGRNILSLDDVLSNATHGSAHEIFVAEAKRLAVA